MDAAPFSPERLLSFLRSFPSATGFCVALSGGADSVALLRAMVELRPTLRKPLRALHVHHGLQRDADAWAEFCRRLCGRLGLPLEVVEIEVIQQPRESLEMAARRLRYAAFAQHLRSAEALLMAHHLDDQAETLLLHLFRGAGVDGLAAMPSQRSFARGQLLRPLLQWPREALMDYLRRLGESWVVDASNADPRFDRNFVRHEVLPRIESRWPGASRAMARSAGLLAQQRDLNDDVGAVALVDCYRFATGELLRKPLFRLPTAKRRLVLRRWLELGRPSLRLSAARLDRLEDALRENRTFELRFGEARLVLYRGRLQKSWLRFRQRETVAVRTHWPLRQALRLPAQGIHLEPSQILRVCRWLRPDDVLEVSGRHGGEKLELPNGSRGLKKRLQAWQVPPDARKQLLVFRQGQRIILVYRHWRFEPSKQPDPGRIGRTGRPALHSSQNTTSVSDRPDDL